MDFDREYELESAGIDAFEFSLMDDDERREVLKDAYLDPDDYDMIEFDSSFDAWSNLQSAGLSLGELEFMDEDEKRDALESAGLDPNDYDTAPSYHRYLTPAISQTEISSSPQPTPRSTSSPSAAPTAGPKPNLIREPSSVTDSVPAREPETGSRKPQDSSAVSCASSVPEPRNIVYFSSDNRKTSEAAKRQAEIQKIDRTMKHLRVAIVTLSLLLVVFIVAVSNYMKPTVPSPVPAATPYRTSATSRPSATATPKPTSKAVTVSYPYEGMPESQLYYTSLGSPTSVEKCKDFDAYRPIRRYKTYTWKKNGETYFTATTSYWKNGEEVSGYVSSIWKSNRFKEDHPTKAVAPYVGQKLSHDGLYFLGGGGKVGGVSTSKFRYSVGSKTYVVYLDNDYVIRKIEDYLPQSSGKKSSSSSSSSSGNSNDPYDAKSYSHPDDFYYDYYDDFWDYEDAEDYWEEYY